MFTFQQVPTLLGVLFLAAVINGRAQHAKVTNSPLPKEKQPSPTNVAVPQAPKLHLGCKFEDDKYTLKTEKHVYGTEMEPEKMNKTEFSSFMKRTEAIFKAVQTTYVMNDVDAIVKFVQDYKNQSGKPKDLETFYKDYNIQSDLVKDSATMVLFFFEELIKVHPQVADNLFLVRTVTHPGLPDYALKLRAHNQDPGLSKRAFNVRDERVAGALRVDVDGNIKTIIFDLELGVSSPVLIVNYHGAKMYETKSTDTAIHFRQVDDSFVIALEYEQDDYSIMKKYLYYTGLPYCSFLSTYSKPNLLSLEHSIFAQKMTGPARSVAFRVIPVKYFERMSYRMTVFCKMLGKFLVSDMEFRNLVEELEASDKMKFIMLGSEIKVSFQELTKKLQIARDVLMTDKKLVTELYDLSEKYRIADKEQGNKCELYINDKAKLVECLETITGAKEIINEFEAVAGRPLWDEEYDDDDYEDDDDDDDENSEDEDKDYIHNELFKLD